MDFAPAEMIVGNKAHPIRSVEVLEGADLPEGIYHLVDLHCTDPSCDCRKSIIQVISDEQMVGQVHYGWETVEFYRKWMGSGSGPDPMADDMAGLSDAFSPITEVPSHVILELIKGLLDEKWSGELKENYALVKAATALRSKSSISRSRPRLKRPKKFKGAGSTRK